MMFLRYIGPYFLFATSITTLRVQRLRCLNTFPVPSPETEAKDLALRELLPGYQ